MNDVTALVHALVLLGDDFYPDGLRANEDVARIRANGIVEVHELPGGVSLVVLDSDPIFEGADAKPLTDAPAPRVHAISGAGSGARSMSRTDPRRLAGFEGVGFLRIDLVDGQGLPKRARLMVTLYGSPGNLRKARGPWAARVGAPLGRPGRACRRIGAAECASKRLLTTSDRLPAT